MNKISVIVPIYNKEKYLKECMDSILRQSLKEIEIICINDGSTDDSLDILQQYSKTDKRIKIVNQPNSGVSVARNKGIDISTAEFLMFIDPDDYYPETDILEELYTAAVRENVAICGGSFSECHEDGSIRIKWSGIYEDYTFDKDCLLSYSEYQFDYGFHRFLYSSNLIKSNKIYYPPYIRFQDPPFMARAMQTAGKFFALKKITYCYRWGYQKLVWDNKRVNDLVKGIADNIQIACDNNFSKLLYLNYRRLTNEYFDRIRNCMTLENEELINMLLYINNQIDSDLLAQGLSDSVQMNTNLPLCMYFANDDYCSRINELSRKTEELENEISNIYHSKTYCLGKLLLYLPRKIKGVFERQGQNEKKPKKIL